MFDITKPIMLIAQQAPAIPPAPGEGLAPNGGPAAPSGPGGGQPSPMGQGFFWIVMLMIVGMLVLTWVSQRRERKRREAMISAIKKHDRVQTIGGVIGSVVEVKPDYVVLKVDESSNTRITFSRAAIQQVLTQSSETSAKEQAGG